MGDLHPFVTPVWQWLSSHGARIVITVVLAVLAVRLARAVVHRVFAPLVGANESEMEKRAETLRTLVSYTTRIIVYAVATMTVLGELGLNVGPVLAAAGIVGVAVGFGAQQLVQDVISGFFILIEDQIRVGDVIKTGSFEGRVECITLRTITLRDHAGNVHYIRNGKIDVITNMTKDFSYYAFDVGVAYRTGLDEVVAALEAADAELRSDGELGPEILAPIEVLGVERFSDTALVVKARSKTKPNKQWRVGRELNRLIKRELDTRGIEARSLG